MGHFTRGTTVSPLLLLLWLLCRQALEACEEWCSDRLARSGAVVAAPLSAAQGGGGGIGASGASHAPPRRLSSAADLYEGLLTGEIEVSPHLPLHRTAAAFLQGGYWWVGGAHRGLRRVCVGGGGRGEMWVRDV